VASVQSLTLWLQVTIEITRGDHFIIACSCHLHVGVILSAHPVRGESHIPHCADWEVAILAKNVLKFRTIVSNNEVLLKVNMTMTIKKVLKAYEAAVFRAARIEK